MMRINKKLALMSMLALAGTTGSIFTYLHQSNPAIVHADDNNDALSHGDYDGWSDQVDKSHFVIINALTNQKLSDESNANQAKIDEENKSIFANGRKVYQKYGFKDHMTEAETNKAYQNLYNAYFGSADGIKNYANDLNEIYKDCGPSGYSVVAVKTDDQDPQQFDILVTPKGQESSFKDQVIKVYQSDFDHDKKLVKDGNDYRAASFDLIAKYYFDQGSNASSSASSTSSSAASASASSSAAATATKPSSAATSTSKANHDDTKTVETNLVPTPLPSESNSSNDDTSDSDSPADSNDNPNDSNSPTDSSNDDGNNNNGQAGSQSATNAQPASNGQSDSQTAASPNNQTLPQTGTKASAGLLILAAIPLLSGFQILTPNNKQK